MSRTGIITRAPNGTYFTNLQEYSPVKLSKLRKARNTPTPTGRNPKADKPKVVLTRKEVPAAPAPVTPAYDVDALISTLTIAQARDLFAALKRMFA
jgi:hypothetical protein